MSVSQPECIWKLPLISWAVYDFASTSVDDWIVVLPANFSVFQSYLVIRIFDGNSISVNNHWFFFAKQLQTSTFWIIFDIFHLVVLFWKFFQRCWTILYWLYRFFAITKTSSSSAKLLIHFTAASFKAAR